MRRQNLSIFLRSGSLVICLTLLVGALWACSSPNESPPPEPITLTFACPSPDRAAYEAVASAFQQANPDVTVRVLSTEELLTTAPQAGAGAAAYVDAVYGTLRRLASSSDSFFFSESGVEGGPGGLVMNLTSFIEAAGEPAGADFIPGLLDRFRWQGGTWGLPAGVDPALVFYDPAAFESEGLPPPTAEWTWDDLLNLAQQLTRVKGGQTVRYGFADLGYLGARSAIEARGAYLVDTAVEPPRPALDDPRTVAAVEWYADLALRHGVMLNPAQGGTMLGAVQSGKAALAIGNARARGDWEQGASDSLQVAPLPGRSPVGVSGYFISAGTAHPEAAWRWLQFLSQRIAPAGELPARRSLIPDSAYAAKVGEEALKVLRYAAEHALPPVRPVGVAILLDVALERVFAGESVKDVLAGAQGQASAIPPLAVNEPLVLPTLAPTRPTTERITFVTTGLIGSYPALVEAFHEAHPEIQVVVRSELEFRPTPADVPYSWDLAELIAVSHADCLRWPGRYSEEERQALLSLQPFVDADSTFPLDDYAPWALEAARHDGDLWGLPAGLIAPVLYYKRNLFDEAGLPYPQSGWTWDDLFTTARTLAGGEGPEHRYGFVIWPHGWFSILDLLQSVGGNQLDAALLDKSGVPMPFRFDAPEVVALAQQLASLVQDGVVPSSRLPENEQSGMFYKSEIYDMVQSGRVGMSINGATLHISLLENEGTHVAPLPKGDRCVAPTLLFTYHIVADTTHAGACWEWLRFLSEHTVLESDGLPPRHSLLTLDAFREQVGAEAQAVYEEALACDNPINSASDLEGLPYSGWAYFLLEDAVREILWQGADAQSALNQAQQKAKTYLDCLWQRPALEDSESAWACLEGVRAP